MQDTDIDAAALHLHALQSAAQRGLRLPVHLRPREPIDGWRIQRRVSALRARPVHGWKCALPPADRWVVAALHDVWPSPAGLRAPAGSPGVARVEPEFAFEFTSTLPARSAPYAEHEVDRAVGAVRLAVEVLGCRFAEPAEASGPELMADSLWHHALVLGGRIKGALPEAPRFTLRVIRPDAPAIVLAAAHADGNPRRALY